MRQIGTALPMTDETGAFCWIWVESTSTHPGIPVFIEDHPGEADDCRVPGEVPEMMRWEGPKEVFKDMLDARAERDARKEVPGTERPDVSGSGLVESLERARYGLSRLASDKALTGAPYVGGEEMAARRAWARYYLDTSA